MSKSNETSETYQWHCSRDISALATSTSISEEEFQKTMENTTQEYDDFKFIDMEYAYIIIYKKGFECAHTRRLDKYNEQIYYEINNTA